MFLNKGEKNPTPTIKGIFVRSHINALKNLRGEEAITELERRFGSSVAFGTFEEVPVSDEIRILEHTLDIINDDKVDPRKRSFEAGRLHFTNFINTPLGRLVLERTNNLKKILMNARTIAENVFKGISYRSYDTGPQSVKIVMKGGVYPLEHFEGFFHEWVIMAGYEPNVRAEKTGAETYEYALAWEKTRHGTDNDTIGA